MSKIVKNGKHWDKLARSKDSYLQNPDVYRKVF